MDDLDLHLEFTKEAREYLDHAEPILIELLQDENATDVCDDGLINDVFRLFHSIKGSAGFLQLGTVASLTHEAETVLDLVRGGSMRMTRDVIRVLCETLDLLRSMVEHIEETGDDSPFEDDARKLREALNALTKPDEDQARRKTIETKELAERRKVTAVYEKTSPSVSAADNSSTSAPSSVSITDEMRVAFCQESLELIEASEQSLLHIPDDLTDADDCLFEALRHLHSFKGNCAYMELHELNQISHRLETVIGCLREGQLELSGPNKSVLLNMLDVVRNVVQEFAEGENANGSVRSYDVYLSFLDDMIPKDLIEQLDAETRGEDAASASTSDPAGDAGSTAPCRTETNTSAATSGASATLGKSTAAARSPQAEANKAGSTAGARKKTGQDIRVDLGKLDALINLVGELVIAESMLTGCPAVAEIVDEYYEKAKHQMRRICDDLQDVAMNVRMIPLATTFRKMTRLVHDVSTKADKKIQLKLIGEATEVDKTVIERIGDPLVHIIRNSCDHGIEPPQERLAAGKTEGGTVTIEAKHQAGEVWITISDDGRGLSREKILSKAIQRGLATAPGDDLSDEQVFRFIFEPGFSTAEQITDISGRGVGMDVVRRNLEDLNGRIDVRSQLGEGTKITLRIPLTLAIIDGMLVQVGDAKYTLPTLAIRESLRPTPEQITTTPDGAEILRLRDEFIPVVRLRRVFGLSSGVDRLEEGILIVVEDAGTSMAILVDEMIGQRQTVIKALSGTLGKARGCAGCTILGDGTVSLILDMGSLLTMATESAQQVANQRRFANKAVDEPGTPDSADESAVEAIEEAAVC